MNRIAWTSAAALALVIGLMLVHRIESDPQTTQAIPFPPGVSADSLLVPSEPRMDLGILPKGGRQERTFWLSNPGSGFVEITKVETSCDCLEVLLNHKVLAPRERVEGWATVDFSKDPAFTGRLELEAVGAAARPGKVGFTIRVIVKVE